MYIEDNKIIQAKARLNILKKELASKTNGSFASNYQKIIEMICAYYHNDVTKILKVGMHQRSKEVMHAEEDLIRNFAEQGILCSHESFKHIGQSIRNLKNAIFGKNADIKSITSECLFGTFSFENIAALNTYDYHRLEDELKTLMERFGVTDPSSLSPTLALILREKLTNNIPGRLPYNYHYQSQTMKRYQRFRILDDILATAETPLSNSIIINELISRLQSECDVKKICRQGPGFSDYDAMLKNDFEQLADLISIETHHGEKQAYERKGVYDLSVKGKRKYLNGVRAFELVITDREAYQIDKELRNCKILKSDKGKILNSWEFPMLEALRIYGKSYSAKGDVVCSKNQNDSKFRIIDYYVPDDSYIFKEAERFVYEKTPLILSPVCDRPRIYIPLSIKQNGSKWVLIASDSKDGKLHALPPEVIKNLLETSYTENRDLLNFRPDFLVGLHAPDEGYEEPVDVTLTLTPAGFMHLVNSGNFYEQARFFSDDSPFGELRITVYLNEGFFCALKSEAKRDNLINISPEYVKKWFETRLNRVRPDIKVWYPEAAKEKALNGKVSRSTKNNKKYKYDEDEESDIDPEREAWTYAQDNKDMSNEDLINLGSDDIIDIDYI